MGFHLWQALVVHWPQSPQTDGLGQRPVMMMMTGSPFSSSNPILLVKCERKWIPSFPSTLRISCVIAPVRDLYSSSLSLSSITSLLPLQWLQIPFPDELERQDERERARRRNCLVGEKEKEDPFSRALIAFSSSLPPRDFNSNCVVFDPFPHSSRRAVKIGAIKWTLWRWRQEKWKNQFDCHRRKCGNSLSLSLWWRRIATGSWLSFCALSVAFADHPHRWRRRRQRFFFLLSALISRWSKEPKKRQKIGRKQKKNGKQKRNEITFRGAGLMVRRKKKVSFFFFFQVLVLFPNK